MKPLFKSKISLWASVLALVMIIGVGATLALMASPSNSVTNSFSAAGIDTEVDEVLTNGDKQVQIENKGPSDGYVRARVMVSGVNGFWNGDNDLSGQVKVVSTEPTDDTLIENPYTVYLVMPNYVSIASGDSDIPSKQNRWFYVPELEIPVAGDDSAPEVIPGTGYFYYDSVLPAHEKTELLLEKVVFGNELKTDEEFLNNFSITIYHESVVALNQNLTGILVKPGDLNFIPVDLLTITDSFPDTNLEPYFQEQP